MNNGKNISRCFLTLNFLFILCFNAKVALKLYKKNFRMNIDF